MASDELEQESDALDDGEEGTGSQDHWGGLASELGAESQTVDPQPNSPSAAEELPVAFDAVPSSAKMPDPVAGDWGGLAESLGIEASDDELDDTDLDDTDADGLAENETAGGSDRSDAAEVEQSGRKKTSTRRSRRPCAACWTGWVSCSARRRARRPRR